MLELVFYHALFSFLISGNSGTHYHLLLFFCECMLSTYLRKHLLVADLLTDLLAYECFGKV